MGPVATPLGRFLERGMWSYTRRLDVSCMCHADEVRVAASLPPLAAEGVRLTRVVSEVDVIRGDPLLEEQAVLIEVVVVVIIVIVIIMS